MAGVGDIGELRVRHELEELFHSAHAQEIAASTAHKQRRHAHLPGGLAKEFGVLRRARWSRPVEEPRVPMPSPPAIGAEPQVPRKPRQILGTRAIRQVRSDGVRRVLDRREAVGPRLHEGDNARDAFRLDRRRDIDQHQSARDAVICFRDEGCEAAE